MIDSGTGRRIPKVTLGQTNDYAPVNLGQLKTVAEPFYDRLIAIGYRSGYPWTNPVSPADDFALANLGQAKNLFAFDPAHDSDGDGLPDWWEDRYELDKTNPADGALDADGDGFSNLYEYQHHTDPRDFYNGALPVITVVSGNGQSSDPGVLLGVPLRMRVLKKWAGTLVPLADAPVSFAVAVGGGKIIVPTTSGPPVPVSSVQLTTDADGYAQVSYQQPAQVWVRSSINVTATTGKRTAQAVFYAVTNFPSGGGGGGGGNPANDPDGDWDHDGLTNQEEIDIGSDPQNPDSDGDGVMDGTDAMPTDPDILFPRTGAPHYALIDIGPGTISGLNGKGEAVGTVLSDPGSTADPVPFFWSKGTRKTLQGRKPSPRSVNDSGAIVGSAEFEVPGVSGTYNVRAAHWVNADSEPIDLGSLGKITTTGNSAQDKLKKPGEWGTSVAVAINNNGMIVGNSSHHVHGEHDPGVIDYSGGDSNKAVRFNVGGKPTLLGPGKKDDIKISNSVTALSEGGVAVGHTDDPDDYTGAALWDNGVFSKDLGEDFTPTGITSAPPEDTRYKYYVTGSTTDIDPPGAGSDPDTGTRLKLRSKDSDSFVTKKLPTASALGITTNGLAFAVGTDVWRNGKDDDFTAKISIPDGSTFDGVNVQTAIGILGGNVTGSSASVGASAGGLSNAAATAVGVKRANILLPVEVRIVQYEDGPHGSKPMYSIPKPDYGDPVGELFSLWPNEKATFEIGAPLGFLIDSSGFKSGSVKWSADDITMKNDTAYFDVQWSTSGMKQVHLEFGSLKLDLHVSIPNTGSLDLSQNVVDDQPLIRQIGLDVYVNIGLIGNRAQQAVAVRYFAKPGTKQDAIRHSTWNACSAVSYGKFKTLLVTTANEYHGQHSDKALASNTTMDLHNNEVGATAGDAHFNTLPLKSMDELIREMETKFSNGDLWAWTPPNADVFFHDNILRKSNMEGACLEHEGVKTEVFED